MKSFWQKVSVQVVGILIATAIIAIIAKVYMKASAFIGSNEFIFLLIIFSVVLIALIFSIHAYFRANRYINERKSIMDAILVLMQKCSSIEEMAQEIQRLDSDVNKPDYKKMLSRAFINIDT